ncbi:hypothetical protein CLOP_g22028 [Closterium sp. NIES-67]|nr:hypothetical protein CLOP_g22028 [Closterium sp. NIES-67]
MIERRAAPSATSSVQELYTPRERHGNDRRYKKDAETAAIVAAVRKVQSMEHLEYSQKADSAVAYRY